MYTNYIIVFVYLFAYYQICPAIEYSVAKEIEVNKTQLIKTENYREKRWIQAFVIAIAAGFISGTVSRLLGDLISKLIYGKRLRRSDNHVSLITSKLNLNYNNAIALKRKITSMNPKVGNAIMVNPNGFRCNDEFCKGKATGHYAVGLCSKYMCYCNNGKPGPLECGAGLVFDPVGKNCNNPRNMVICGM